MKKWIFIYFLVSQILVNINGLANGGGKESPLVTCRTDSIRELVEAYPSYGDKVFLKSVYVRILNVTGDSRVKSKIQFGSKRNMKVNDTELSISDYSMNEACKKYSNMMVICKDKGKEMAKLEEDPVTGGMQLSLYSRYNYYNSNNKPEWHFYFPMGMCQFQ